MRTQNRPSYIERLEGRLMLAAAPVVAKLSTTSKVSSPVVASPAKLTPAVTVIAPVFEADFNGTGALTGSTGDGGDIVTTGGTGAFGTTTGVTNSLTSAAAFAVGSGNYINSAVAAGSTSGQTVATFTPTSSATTWSAIAGSISVNSVNYLTLNGGFDLFVRPDSTKAGDNSWFRPVDISNISGTTGMRLILAGDSGGQLQFQILTGTGTDALGSTAGSFTTNSSFSLTGGLSNMANPFVNGTTEHVGFAFSTSATGLITVSVFAVAGTGAINTSSTTNLLGTQSFYASASVIGSAALPTGAWAIGNRYSNAQATSIDYDTVRLYAGGTPATFPALATTLTAAPVILTISDAVKPNGIISITGGGIDAASAVVAIALDTTGSPPTTPPANALYPTILEYDGGSQFISARMPATATPGVYDVWVKNAYGWSTPTQMNEARALYQSDYQAYAGINIEVIGRNFEQSEFGGTNQTLVQLNNGTGGIYSQTVASLNPYDVSFNVSSSVPIGTYTIQVSNDNGVHWSSPSSGQTLSIISHTGTDPLGLGVSWAQGFKWTSIFNVTSYGATGSDTTDDTTAVKSAIAAASAAGGGVVYFPNGSYYIGGLSLPSNIVLEGQSESGTTLVYDGGGGSSWIRSTLVNGAGVQYQGIADLSITLSNPTSLTLRPDEFLNLGNSLSSYIFVDSVNMSYPYTTGDSSGSDGRRAIGLMFGAYQDVLIANNHFVGWEATMPDDTVTQYAAVRNNYFEYSTGYVHDSATYAFFENNTLVIHNEYDQDSHGIFGRADAYMANNSVTGAGDASNVQNDGEALATEGGASGTVNFGNVTSATATTMTVTTQQPLAMPTTIPYGVLSVVITDGTGLGELDPVTAISGSVITLAKPFTIVPDSTSRFTLEFPLSGMTVYDNTINNCAKGIWVYGLAYDDVVADNTSINSYGIYVHAVVNEQGTNASDGASFFVRITNNTVTGVSRRGGFAGIGLNTGRFGTATFVSVQNFGTEILYNSITGNNAEQTGSGTGEAGPFSGIFAISDGFSTGSNGTGTGDETDFIVDGNLLSNLKVGITLSNSDYGQLIADNSYDNQVLTFLLNSASSSYGASQYTVVTSDNGIPGIATQPISQSVTSGQTVTFTVAVLAPGAVTYQWMDGTTPVGTNSPTLTLTSAQVANSGSYTCIITNSSGSTTSNVATLVVTLPSWLATGSVVNWNSTTGVLTVTGAATIIANPGTAEPNIVASGSAAQLSFQSTTGTQFQIGGLSLTNGASATVVSLGTARSVTNFNVLVVGLAGASVAPTFTIDPTSTLNMTDNDLIVLYGSGNSPYAAIRSEIAQAYDGAAWDKPGLTSSAAKSNPSTYGLGYAEASALGLSTFDGVTLGGNAVLVKFTVVGDANLNGKVDLGDYDTVLSNFGSAGNWTSGNFDFSGTVGLGDYDAILNNFGASLSTYVATASVVAPAASTSVAASPTVAAKPSKVPKTPVNKTVLKQAAHASSNRATPNLTSSKKIR